MRHNKKFNHLGRTASHRRAMLSNMANSLIQHKRITTTLAKAKALRVYLEPLVTKSKNNTTHSRRVVFSKLQNKYAVAELFSNVADKVGERPGGYLRILKLGRRQGDDAMMAIIEFVDFNEERTKVGKKSESTKKTRRSRRGGSKKSADASETKAADADKSKKAEEAVSEEKTATPEAADNAAEANEAGEDK